MPAAKKPQTHATRRRQSAADSRKSALIWYGSGVVSGALASLLVGLSLWPAGPAAITAPGIPGDAATAPAAKSHNGPAKPRFDFYTVLHDQEVRVSEDDPVLAGSKNPPTASTPVTPTEPARTAPAVASATPPGKPPTSDKTAESPKPVASETGKERYLLQVGSFTQPEEADRLRAQLLLLGLQASVQKIPRDGQTWHRVQVGPFSSQEQLNTARRSMSQQQIESIVLKLR